MFLRDNSPDIKNPNMWQLPGGVVEPGEFPDDTLKRELKEEINIVPRNIVSIGKKYKPSGQVGHYFFVVLTDDEVRELKKGEEGQEIKFFNFDELGGLELSGGIGGFYNTYTNILRVIAEEQRSIAGSDLGLE